MLSRNTAARCACEGGEGSCSGVRWRNPTARANTAYPQKLEHRPPALPHNVAGRQRQPLALPRGMPNAGGGRGAERYCKQLGLVEEGGNEAAHAGDVCIIICRRVRHTKGAEADGYADET
jgi:hypothetical protein